MVSTLTKVYVVVCSMEDTVITLNCYACWETAINEHIRQIRTNDKTIHAVTGKEGPRPKYYITSHYINYDVEELKHK